MTEKTISEFLSKEYKDFSLYVIENRAIPSVIDGLKTSQRKIIHISNQVWKTGNEKELKVFQLGGKVASDCYYHHGNVSMENAIITMAQDFKNNMPLLEGIGQFGSLRSPEPGAARYIGVKLNKNFRILYRDFELLEYKKEEGETIEPNYFLPIVPTILVNGSSGIAVGFSSNILNRNITHIINACESVLKDKKIQKISPAIPNFKGTFSQDAENHKRWIIRGTFEIVNTTTVRITELPPSMTFEKYDSILDDLLEKKVITSYDDNCKDSIDYTVKFSRESLSKYDEAKLMKILKLEEFETEVYSTLDEWGKLKIFENIEDIIRYFVDFRLGFYDKRKKYLLDKIEDEMKVLSNRAKFIKAIIENKLEVKNVKKDVIIKNIDTLNIDKIDGGYDYLLRMPIWSLTKELYDKLKEDFKTKEQEREKLLKLSPKDMYLEDLQELKKKVK